MPYGITGYRFSSVRDVVMISCVSECSTPVIFQALTFVLAPIPNAIFPHCCGADEYATSFEDGAGSVDIGRFITAIIVVTGFAFPIVLAHSEIINTKACVMSIVGGGCVFSFIQYLEPKIDFIQGWYMVQLWHMRLLSSKTILNTSEHSVAPLMLSLYQDCIIRTYRTVYRYSSQISNYRFSPGRVIFKCPIPALLVLSASTSLTSAKTSK